MNGVRFDARGPGEFIASVGSFSHCGQTHVVHFLAADPVVIAQGDDAFLALLNRSDLNVPDGMAVVWASRLLGHESVRLAGTEGLDLVLEWGLDRAMRHFFFGGAPQCIGRLVAELRTRHEGIEIAGAVSPPFRDLADDELEAYADRIREARTEALWIGLGTPKQQIVAERFRALRPAPLIFTVGAAFDFVSGMKPRAPAWMRRSGLEWLYRLKSEPKRLWKRYLVGNPRFLAAVLGERLLGSGRTAHPPNRPLGRGAVRLPR